MLRSAVAFSLLSASSSTPFLNQFKLSTRGGGATASKSKLDVASKIDIPDVASMERGAGGRIEDAFASAKERGEAAFVSFITAGYPTAEGT